MKFTREEKDLIFWDLVLNEMEQMRVSYDSAFEFAFDQLGYKPYYNLNSYYPN